MNYEDILEKIYSNIIFAGDCAIDIGAHSGRHCKPIIAFEFGQASYESYNVDPGDVYNYLYSPWIPADESFRHLLRIFWRSSGKKMFLTHNLFP